MFSKNNDEITSSHTPPHFVLNYNYWPDILGIAIIRTSPPTHIKFEETLSSDHNPAIFILILEQQKHTKRRTDPHTTKHAYYRQLLQQEFPGNPNIN
jgi:hypothetical protein